MKVSEKWLREWFSPSLSVLQIADQLMMGGFPVESIQPAGGDFDQVIVGLIESFSPHPESDRLSCCQVRINADTVLPIVCGAVNVVSGIKVAVVVVGGKIGDQIIREIVLKGKTSYGMICSEKELGLTQEDAAKNILILPQDAPVGMPIGDYLQLEDHILDIDITPNRGDCLSVLGLSRELAALNGVLLPSPKASKPAINLAQQLTVKMMSPSCLQYQARVIRGLPKNLSTPIMIQERLRRSGVRSISYVVDVLNYVMLELGQPLHAFDLNKWQGDTVEVRLAKKNESFVLLNKEKILLASQDLVIADNTGAVALAGVMGGLNTAVDANTTDILLESAVFIPSTVAATSRRLNIKTEASYRFERGVDLATVEMALERATELLSKITREAIQVGPIVTVGPARPPLKQVRLPRTEITSQLGFSLSDKEIELFLTALGVKLEPKVGGWLITVPSYRHDIHSTIDLIEELARLYGYDRITPTVGQSLDRITPISYVSNKLTDLRQALKGRAYHEAITYSFIDQTLQEKFMLEEGSALSLINPISTEMGTMRTSLWPGLLKVLEYNQNRQMDRIRLFETGVCFIREEDKKEWGEVPFLGALAAGPAHLRQWGEMDRPLDFYDVAGDLLGILNLLYPLETLTWADATHPALHPGQSVAVLKNDQKIAHMGRLHPQLEQDMSLNGPIFLFELSLEGLNWSTCPRYESLPKFPSVRRDIAVVLDQMVEAQALKQEILSSAGPLLNKLQIFDIYAGEGVEFGKKSVALDLTFQHPSRTLRDEEINQIITKVVSHLENVFKAKLRA